MASRSPYQAHEKGAEIADALDALDRQLERLRALYEQYFMGTQKLVPAQLHRELERKLRELTQLQIRNTALRFRLNTLTQKFGSYNTYWRRTMRQIEQGRYLPHIARVARKAGREGVEVPEEILAAMPKRMRERVRRDRQRIAERDDAEASAAPEEEGQAVRSPQQRAHQLDERLLGDDFDLDSMFASITSEAEAVVDAREPGGRQEPPKPAAVREVGASLPVATVGAPRASTPPGPQPPRAAPPPRASTPPGPQPPRAASPPAPPGPRPTPPPIPRARPRSAPPPPPGMDEPAARQLYQQYVEARRVVGEKSPVTYEKLVDSLNRQAPRIMKEHNARGVDFKVVIRDAKVVLKATPKR